MAFIKCPQCGAENNEMAPACFRCGFPLKNGQDYGYRDDLQTEPTVPIETEPLYQDFQPAPERTERKTRPDLKLMLMMILGGVALSLCLMWDITRMQRYLPLMFFYILGDGATLCAMFFRTLKKKIPAIILAAAGILFAMLLPLGYFLAAGSSFRYLINATTIISMVLSVCFPTLLLLYTLIGDRHEDSMLWMLIFIGLALLNRALNTGIDLFTLVVSAAMGAYYLIGYIPAKWLRNVE